jgi:hypothetical protein
MNTNVEETESSECNCPICLENIDAGKNKTTTDCGHSFHTSCIMKNVAHNGFGCPYCRTVMAENPNTDEQSEESDYTYLDMEESEDYVMRGMRFMFQRAEGEDFDEEDIEDEDYDQEQIEENSERESIDTDDAARRPARYNHSYESVVAKLAERNVSPENILKALLYNFSAYCNNTEYEMIDLHVTDIIADILSVPEYEGHQRIII